MSRTQLATLIAWIPPEDAFAAVEEYLRPNALHE